jgi:hypothetical protein
MSVGRKAREPAVQKSQAVRSSREVQEETAAQQGQKNQKEQQRRDSTKAPAQEVHPTKSWREKG